MACRIRYILLVITLVFVTLTLLFSLSVDTPNRVVLVCPSPTLSKSNLPLTALASFPGSGNTWFRHLLQLMTGVQTGSIYNDVTLKKYDFQGEGRQDERVIAIKTHINYGAKKKNYKRAILLVRNPYEAFLSEFTRLTSHSHVGRVNVFDFIGWRYFVDKQISAYHQFYTSWFNHKKMLVIFYDKLKSNLRKELARTKVFVDDENITGNIECALVDSEGNFHRNKTDITLDFFYLSDDRARINDLIDEMHGELRRRLNETCDNMLKWKL